MNPLLSKHDCTVARGVAIVGIILHNYCHGFEFAIKESEFSFKLHETQRLIDYCQHIDSNVFINLFSCFGFYGVAMFMFLTGYGLVFKYENCNKKISISNFLIKHYKKLLTLMIVPYMIYLALLCFGAHIVRITPVSFITQLTFTTNLFPATRIDPFIYWYLGLAMQLYVIYAIICQFKSYRAQLWIPIMLIIAGIAIHILVGENEEYLEYVRINAPVAFIPFGLGLLSARYTTKELLTKRQAKILLPLLLIMIVAFSFNYYLWILNYAVSCIATICLVRLLRGWTTTLFAKIGAVSSLIFVLHPTCRLFVHIIRYDMVMNPHLQVLTYIVVTAITVYIYHLLSKRVKAYFIR